MLQRTPKQQLQTRMKWMIENIQNIDDHISDIQNILRGQISDQSDIHAIWSLLEKIDDEILSARDSHEEAVKIADNELTLDFHNSLPNPGVGYPEQYAK